MQTVNRNITEEFELTNQQDLEGLKTLYCKMTMDYYLALSLETLALQEDSDNEEAQIAANLRK